MAWVENCEENVSKMPKWRPLCLGLKVSKPFDACLWCWGWGEGWGWWVVRWGITKLWITKRSRYKAGAFILHTRTIHMAQTLLWFVVVGCALFCLPPSLALAVATTYADCPDADNQTTKLYTGRPDRDHFVYARSQWETTLQCNVVSHWLCACIGPVPVKWPWQGVNRTQVCTKNYIRNTITHSVVLVCCRRRQTCFQDPGCQACKMRKK